MSGTPGIYHKHITQRNSANPNWRVACTETCTAMLVNDSTLGGLEGINPQLIRALSSEPVPDPKSPGLNLVQVDAVCKRLRVPFYNKTGETWTKLKAYVGREGASRAIVQVDYDTLQAAGASCQSSGSFDHALLIINVHNGVVHLSDPLCATTTDRPEAVIKAAAIKFGHDHTATGGALFFGISRTVPKQCG